MIKFFYVEVVNFELKEKFTYYVYYRGHNETEIYNQLEAFLRDHSDDEDYIEWDEITEGFYRANMNYYGDLD